MKCAVLARGGRIHVIYRADAESGDHAVAVCGREGMVRLAGWQGIACKRCVTQLEDWRVEPVNFFGWLASWMASP